MQHLHAREASGAFLLLFHALVSVGLDSIPPATFLIAFTQACVYLRLFSLPWSDVDDVCIGVIGVLFKGEWQRIFYGAIEHMDSLHLYYNMVSFVWKGINLEGKVGPVQFIWDHLHPDRSHRRPHRRPLLLAGHLRRRHILQALRHRLLWRHFRAQVWFEPLLAQFVTGNGSFVGHFAGALAGLVYLGMLKPIFNVAWLVLVDAPRSAVRYLCPCLLPVPYGAVLLSAALLATNADFLPTSELKLKAISRPSSSSSLVIGEGQWHLLLAPVLRCSGRLHLAYNMATLLGLGYRLERKVGTVRFLVDAAILAIVTNVAYCLTAHYALPNYNQIAGVSPTQTSHMSLTGPTAILLALKALYGGGRWLRKYPLLFLAVPNAEFRGRHTRNRPPPIRAPRLIDSQTHIRLFGLGGWIMAGFS
ncbi:hypothetical protein MTO96_004635 [Rhipicephalus appendiculatus]